MIVSTEKARFGAFFQLMHLAGRERAEPGFAFSEQAQGSRGGVQAERQRAAREALTPSRVPCIERAG
jgi:hypothetical protein